MPRPSTFPSNGLIEILGEEKEFLFRPKEKNEPFELVSKKDPVWDRISQKLKINYNHGASVGYLFLIVSSNRYGCLDHIRFTPKKDEVASAEHNGCEKEVLSNDSINTGMTRNMFPTQNQLYVERSNQVVFSSEDQIVPEPGKIIQSSLEVEVEAEAETLHTKSIQQPTSPGPTSTREKWERIKKHLTYLQKLIGDKDLDIILDDLEGGLKECVVLCEDTKGVIDCSVKPKEKKIAAGPNPKLKK